MAEYIAQPRKLKIFSIQGFSDSEQDVHNFIKNEFHSIAKSHGREMYHHITQATGIKIHYDDIIQKVNKVS